MYAFLLAASIAIAAAQSSSTCTSISVNEDATYCIEGIICAGSGLLPAGTVCPKKGDIATGDCYSYLPSYSNGECIAPVDAECQVIPSGAWGCVWSNSTSNSTSSTTTTSDVIVAPTTTTTTDGSSTTTVDVSNTTDSNSTSTNSSRLLSEDIDTITFLNL